MITLAEAEELRRRRDWPAAYDAYADLPDRTPAVVEGVAEAAWWLGRMDEAIMGYTDAYRGYLDAGGPEAAARVAVLL